MSILPTRAPLALIQNPTGLETTAPARIARRMARKYIDDPQGRMLNVVDAFQRKQNETERRRADRTLAAIFGGDNDVPVILPQHRIAEPARARTALETVELPPSSPAEADPSDATTYVSVGGKIFPLTPGAPAVNKTPIEQGITLAPSHKPQVPNRGLELLLGALCFGGNPDVQVEPSGIKPPIRKLARK